MARAEQIFQRPRYLQEKSPLWRKTQENSKSDSASGPALEDPENAGQPAEHFKEPLNPHVDAMSLLWMASTASP